MRVRFTRSAADVERADLVVVPGTKATVEDLDRLRAAGLDRALGRAARPPATRCSAICGGYQMLGERIEDEVESGRGAVAGLGLLPVTTDVRAPRRCCAGRRAAAPGSDAAASGLRDPPRARSRATAARRCSTATTASPRAAARGAVLGTSWHGALEQRRVPPRAAACGRRRARARLRARRRRPFAGAREARLDVLGDLVADHLDTDGETMTRSTLTSARCSTPSTCAPQASICSPASTSTRSRSKCLPSY